MKTKLILLGVLYALMVKSHAQTRNEIEQGITAQNFIPRDPWRVLNGRTNYIKINGREFCGKVVDVTSDGIRIEGEFDELFAASYRGDIFKDAKYPDFFVANYPFSVINDQIIKETDHQMAWSVGTYTYSTVNGGSRTIKKLDYGIPCDPPAELIQKQNEAAKAKMIAIKKKALEGQTNVVHWLLSQATNGSASTQYSLGLHYLNGQGCETNKEQAIFWLQKAAAQGDLQASNKLSALKSP